MLEALVALEVVPVGVLSVAVNCLVFFGRFTSNPSAMRIARKKPAVFTDLPLKIGRRLRLVTGWALLIASAMEAQDTHSGLKKPPPSFEMILKWKVFSGSRPSS